MNKVMNSFKYLKCGFVVMYTINTMKSLPMWSLVGDSLTLRQFGAVLTTLMQFMAVYGKCRAKNRFKAALNPTLLQTVTNLATVSNLNSQD